MTTKPMTVNNVDIPNITLIPGRSPTVTHLPRSERRLRLVVIIGLMVCLVVSIVALFMVFFLQTKLTAATNKMEVSNHSIKLALDRSKFYFDLRGQEENGVCETALKMLKFLPSSDPFNMSLPEPLGRTKVIIKQTGDYFLHFRGVRASSTKSCNTTIRVTPQNATNEDWTVIEKFNCPHGTSAGSVINWQVVKCLRQGDSLIISTPDTESFKCKNGQDLTFFGRIILPRKDACQNNQ